MKIETNRKLELTNKGKLAKVSKPTVTLAYCIEAKNVTQCNDNTTADTAIF